MCPNLYLLGGIMQRVHYPFYIYCLVHCAMDLSYVFSSGKLNDHFALCMWESFRNKKLRRPRNFFLINLAIVDLGLLLTNNSMHTIASFNKQWPFGQTGEVVLRSIKALRLDLANILPISWETRIHQRRQITLSLTSEKRTMSRSNQRRRHLTPCTENTLRSKKKCFLSDLVFQRNFTGTQFHGWKTELSFATLDHLDEKHERR